MDTTILSGISSVEGKAVPPVKVSKNIYGIVRASFYAKRRLPFCVSIRNRALRGDEAKAAMTLMAAVVFPLPQGAMTRLKASGTKVEASSTSYKYLPFFIKYNPPGRYWSRSSFFYFYFTAKFGG